MMPTPETGIVKHFPDQLLSGIFEFVKEILKTFAWADKRWHVIKNERKKKNAKIQKFEYRNLSIMHVVVSLLLRLYKTFIYEKMLKKLFQIIYKCLQGKKAPMCNQAKNGQWTILSHANLNIDQNR